MNLPNCQLLFDDIFGSQQEFRGKRMLSCAACDFHVYHHSHFYLIKFYSVAMVAFCISRNSQRSNRIECNAILFTTFDERTKAKNSSFRISAKILSCNNAKHEFITIDYSIFFFSVIIIIISLSKKKMKLKVWAKWL